MTAMLTMVSTPTVIVMCDIHDDLAIDNENDDEDGYEDGDDDDDDSDGDDEDVGGAHQGSGWRIHQRITPARVTGGLVGWAPMVGNGGRPTRPNAQTPHKRKTNSKRKSSNR